MCRSLFIAVLALLCAAVPAHAQGANSQGFALDRFDPAAVGSDWFALDSLDLRGGLRPAVGLTLDYARDPMSVYAPDGSKTSAIVRDQLFAHLGASLVIASRLRLSLNLPVALYQAGHTATVNDQLYPAATSAALGDPRVGADLRLVGTHGGPFTLAVGANVFIPVGSATQYAGDGKVRLSPHLLAAGQVGPFEYAGALAFTYRAQDLPVDGSPFGSELNYGVSAGVRPVAALLIGPELYGATGVSNGAFFASRTSPLELILGAHLHVGDFELGAGAGPGLTKGLGSPEVRGLLSLAWAPAYRAPDGDGDGIADAQDACPTVPGVKTADPKTNGCPPPPPDGDGDGIADAQDACPTVPGVKTADPKTNGCPPPPPDGDGDGIADAQDACPTVPGVKTANPKTNGCPADGDGDGVLDAVDNCPKVPGPASNQGCPVKQKQLVVITRQKIEIKQKVFFDTGKATIKKQSFELLDQVASVIDSHPEIPNIEIEGHTDDRGGAELNRTLSQARAEAVRSYLIHRGVDSARLVAKGYGPDRPIDTNATSAGRANNRRVEFTITGVEKADPEIVPKL